MDGSPPVTADASKQRDSRGTSASATAFLDLLRFTAANLVLLSHIFVVFFDNKKTYQGRGVAVIPSATKTTVKDRQKTIAGKRMRLRRFSPCWISASDMPETADR